MGSIVDDRMLIRSADGTVVIRKMNYSERNLSQYHFARHKSHMDCLKTEASLQGNKPATHRLRHGT